MAKPPTKPAFRTPKISSIVPQEKEVSENPEKSSKTNSDGPSEEIEVLDRLALPVLFFSDSAVEGYLSRYCNGEIAATNAADAEDASLDIVPDRNVMRKLLAMLAGIMSKAAAASSRSLYGRTPPVLTSNAGDTPSKSFKTSAIPSATNSSAGANNFQQNLNTSVINLFSTLSAASPLPELNEGHDARRLLPPLVAKDGDPLRGYPGRLLKFWRGLSVGERLRLVQEEHSALRTSWMELRSTWCMCSHCKHRRMTVADLVDCLYQAYCEELEAFINSKGRLGRPEANSECCPNRQFLYKALSVVGEQAMLPRYNPFILKLEAFSALSTDPGQHAISKEDRSSNPRGGGSSRSKPKAPGFSHNDKVVNALEALAEDENAVAEAFEYDFLPGPNRASAGKAIPYGTNSFRGGVHFINYEDEDEGLDEYDDYDHDGSLNCPCRSCRYYNTGTGVGVQSEDDEELIENETDLPVDEAELILPGGTSFPVIPVANDADSPELEWSEASRIECGRTVFMMFASEMFQYRLSAAYLDHVTRARQLQLLAEVEEEERIERELKQKELDQKLQKMAAKKDKKKKALQSIADRKSSTAKANELLHHKPSEKRKEPEKAVESISSKPIEPVVDKQDATPVCGEISNTDLTTVVHAPMPSSAEAREEPLSGCIQSEDDFDPNDLIEQISKEIKHFEIHQTSEAQFAKPFSPSSSFAPPPGFQPAPIPSPLIGTPASIGPHDYNFPPFYSNPSVRPTFSLNSNDEYSWNSNPDLHAPSSWGYPYSAHHGHQQAFDQHQGQSTYQGDSSNSNHHNPSHGQRHSHLHPDPFFTQSQSHGPSPPPPGLFSGHAFVPPSNDCLTREPNNVSHASDGSSNNTNAGRFQSYFSKSIFGPSSFFSP